VRPSEAHDHAADMVHTGRTVTPPTCAVGRAE